MPARPVPTAVRLLAPAPALIVLAFGLLFWAADRRTREIGPAFATLPVSTQGTFPARGEFPGVPLAHAPAVRSWGSWAGDDRHTGAIRIGPFPAPARLRFAVSGYPAVAGNSLALELAAKGARHAITLADVGEAWALVDVDVPADWVGQGVTLVATDGSTAVGGWLAISEPLRGGSGDGSAAWCGSMAAWLANGAIFAVLWLAAARSLLPRTWLPAPWLPLAAGALVAASGYLAFWIYFASPAAGRWFSIALLTGATAWAAKPVAVARRRTREVVAVALLAAAIGLLYLALLHLRASSADFYALAANRFRPGLPGDNTLPHNLAADLFHGRSPHHAGADWLSSDRPPLQSGWQLLAWPFTAALDLPERVASGTAAIWFQLLWVPAVFGLLRSLGSTARRAVAWTGVIAATGFFAQNTVFTWPKLAAGAFAVGAFAFVVLVARGRRVALPAAGFAALCAALGWLAHGGAAFSLLAMAPWLAWRLIRGEWRAGLFAAAIAGLLAAPWLAYQRWYDPPGNRLLKWHLAGQIAKDSRSTWDTLRDAYRPLSWRRIADAKLANLALQLDAHPAQLADFSPQNAPLRRQEEFFNVSRSLAGWVFAAPALAIGLAFPAVRRRIRRIWLGQTAVAAWVLVTLLAWCTLMFTGTVVHQGSYAVEIALIALAAASLEAVGPWLLAVMLAYQAASFGTTWVVGNDAIHGPLDPAALAATLLSAVALAVAVGQALRPPRARPVTGRPVRAARRAGALDGGMPAPDCHFP